MSEATCCETRSRISMVMNLSPSFSRRMTRARPLTRALFGASSEPPDSWNDTHRILRQLTRRVRTRSNMSLSGLARIGELALSRTTYRVAASSLTSGNESHVVDSLDKPCSRNAALRDSDTVLATNDAGLMTNWTDLGAENDSCCASSIAFDTMNDVRANGPSQSGEANSIPPNEVALRSSCHSPFVSSGESLRPSSNSHHL